MNMIVVAILAALISISVGHSLNNLNEECPSAQYVQFLHKEIDRAFPIINNPYKNPTKEYLAQVKENLQNKQRVCALQYKDSTKKQYSLKNFNTRKQAEDASWIVTHQGTCGKCSTTRDLYVYLNRDLTRKVRRCGVYHPFSHKNLLNCIKALEFSDACAQVWLWNTINTKKHCGLVCMVSLLTNQKFVINGHLNKCLQCDEDISGPIFKFQSGRSRRNSGIKSEIDRPEDEIYNVTHCYY